MSIKDSKPAQVEPQQIVRKPITVGEPEFKRPTPRTPFPPVL